MAVDITKELQEIDRGQFGEDIRWPIYIALSKLAGGDMFLYIIDNLGNYMTCSEGMYVIAKE